MSHKTVICFAIWTSFWSALFNHFYTVYFGSFGVPWIMFVCMAIFFGMNGTPKQVPGMILSAFCGLAWGQFDFILINFFGGTCHMSAEMASFMAILVGTAITMYIHIKLLGTTPLGFMPFIFAGVCLTFSQGGGNVAGLAFTLFVGIILGLALGAVPFSIPGISTPVRLGLAGGPIIVGILIGTFGPRLHMITYTTRSANLMLRALGLSLYLACLGLDAGAHFFDTVFRPEGLLWIATGFALTVVPVLIMGIVTFKWLKIDFGTMAGMLCGSMANPMALNYANDTIPGDNPSVAYATVYPLCMFLRVIIAQVLLMFFING